MGVVMLTMAASIDVVSDSDSDLVARAAAAYAGILRSSRAVLSQKFELGRLVSAHLERHQHAHTAVVDLARRISSSCGKAILPQRLYEAARFYTTFGGVLDRVWAFEKRLAEPLTYTYLIRAIIPRVKQDQAWNRQEWEIYHDQKLTRLERVVQEIESLVPSKCVVDEGKETVSIKPCPAPVMSNDSGPDQTAGLLMMCRDSAGYQQVSASLLVRTLARTVGHLEARTVSLDDDHRRDLHAVAARLIAVAEGQGVVVAA